MGIEITDYMYHELEFYRGKRVIAAFALWPSCAPFRFLRGPLTARNVPYLAFIMALVGAPWSLRPQHSGSRPNCRLLQRRVCVMVPSALAFFPCIVTSRRFNLHIPSMIRGHYWVYSRNMVMYFSFSFISFFLKLGVKLRIWNLSLLLFSGESEV